MKFNFRIETHFCLSYYLLELWKENLKHKYFSEISCPGQFLSFKSSHNIEFSGKVNLSCKQCFIRLDWRGVRGAFFWLRIDMGGSSLSWVMTPSAAGPRLYKKANRACQKKQASNYHFSVASASVLCLEFLNWIFQWCSVILGL